MGWQKFSVYFPFLFWVSITNMGSVGFSATPKARAVTATTMKPLIITDPEELARLERNGADFKVQLTQNDQIANLATFKNTKIYQALVADIKKEVVSHWQHMSEFKFPYSLSLVALFRSRWLLEPKSRLRLIGFLYRPDKILEAADSCGELRLIYRLMRYEALNSGQWTDLPMTLNLIYPLDSKSDGVG